MRELKQGKAIVGTTRSNRLEYQEADHSIHAMLCFTADRRCAQD